MAEHKVFQMEFEKIYGLLLDKVERKGRTREELDRVIGWLTGYAPPELEQLRQGGATYGAFLQRAPRPNPARMQIKGVVCGVRVEAVADPLMREARCLDKLVDELARGKPMEKILRTPEGGEA